MSEASITDHSEEYDSMSSDNEEELVDFDDDGFSYGTKPYMPVLLPGSVLSPEVLTKTTSQFAEVFQSRNPLSELKFFIGSLDAALAKSIFNDEDPRPLVLYIREGIDVTDRHFCGKFFRHKGIVDTLNNEFIVWPWDRTDMNYYRKFLKLIIDTFGSQVASQIESHSYIQTPYPLLVCISNENDRYCVVDPIIDNKAQDEEAMMATLRAISDEFHSDTNLNEDEIKEWYMPSSHRTPIQQGSDQFREILSKLDIEEQKVQAIEQIENILWSVQYSSEKERYENRSGRNPNDKELFYRCPITMAHDILQNGFFSDTKSICVTKQENRFYVTRKRDDYESKTLRDKRNAIMICKILIDESSSDACFLRCNQQILPEYLVVYTE